MRSTTSPTMSKATASQKLHAQRPRPPNTCSMSARREAEETLRSLTMSAYFPERVCRGIELLSGCKVSQVSAPRSGRLPDAHGGGAWCPLREGPSVYTWPPGSGSSPSSWISRSSSQCHSHTVRITLLTYWFDRVRPALHFTCSSLQLIREAGYEFKFESPHSFWVQHHCSKYNNLAFLTFCTMQSLSLCFFNQGGAVGWQRQVLSDGNYMEPVTDHLLHLHSADGDRRVFVFQMLHITIRNDYHVLIIFLLIICNKIVMWHDKWDIPPPLSFHFVWVWVRCADVGSYMHLSLHSQSAGTFQLWWSRAGPESGTVTGSHGKKKPSKYVYVRNRDELLMPGDGIKFKILNNGSHCQRQNDVYDIIL